MCKWSELKGQGLGENSVCTLSPKAFSGSCPSAAQHLEISQQKSCSRSSEMSGYIVFGRIFQGGFLNPKPLRQMCFRNSHHDHVRTGSAQLFSHSRALPLLPAAGPNYPDLVTSARSSLTQANMEVQLNLTKPLNP